MIKAQFSRVFTTTGSIFSDLDEVKAFVQNYPTEIITVFLNQVKFSIKEDIIYADLGSRTLPFSENGMKSLCSILRVPFPYLNKLISNELVLKNLNESPNLYEDEYLFYVHTSEQDEPYISAVSNCESFTYENAVDILERSELTNNINLEYIDITVSNENLTAYLLSDITIEFSDENSCQHGLAILIPEGLNTVAEIMPFVRVHFKHGNSFDFIMKPFKKIRRVEKSFAALLEDELNQVTANLFSEITDDLIKLLNTSFLSSEISFLELKRLRSTISSTFRFQEGVYDTKNIVTELLPEFDSFKSQYKEDMRIKPTFEINNYKIPFFLPNFFSAYEGHVFTLENPLFFNKQRKNVHKLLQYHADIYYSLNS